MKTFRTLITGAILTVAITAPLAVTADTTPTQPMGPGMMSGQSGMPMGGRGAMPMQPQGQAPMMDNPQFMQPMMLQGQQHMQRIERHLTRIESLLQQLVDQKRQ